MVRDFNIGTPPNRAGLTDFKTEAIGATAVNGITWKDLLDKSTLTRDIIIRAFTATVAGTWVGKAKIRIVDGLGTTKVYPHGDEYVQDTDFVSATEKVLEREVFIPKLTGYKVQFRSSDAGDGADDTVALNSLKVIEVE